MQTVLQSPPKVKLFHYTAPNLEDLEWGRQGKSKEVTIGLASPHPCTPMCLQFCTPWTASPPNSFSSSPNGPSSVPEAVSPCRRHEVSLDRMPMAPQR